MENPSNMGDQNNQQSGQNSNVQPVQLPEKPRINYWMLSTVLLAVFLVSGGVYIYKYANFQTSKIEQSPSTTFRINQLSPTSYPKISPSSANVNPVSESITLKVAAIGGGASGDRFDYTFTFNATPEDKIVVLKRDENEIKNFPGYAQGAFDKGLVIKHGTVDLEITPSFEGAGSNPLKNKNPVIISNIALTDAPIYRINQSSIAVPPGSNYTPRVGSYYTVAYKEKPEDCPELSQTAPACAWSQGVTLRDRHNLSIFCTVEDDGATWCDNIVKSLSVSVKKY